MIRSVSKTVYVAPDEIATITVTLNERITDNANFTIESANPGGYWGTCIPQLPKETKVPKEMIVTPFYGVVYNRKPVKTLAIKFLYPTWIRVVQYLSAEEVPTAFAKIAIDTTLRTKIMRWWHKETIEQPHERSF